MIRPILLALSLAVATAPVSAQTQRQGASQLAASIQNDLNFLGFDEVDAQSLSLRQLGALHSLSDEIGFGQRFIQSKYKAQAILRTDGFTTFDGVRVEGRRTGRY